MNLFILGSARFIGSYIADALVNKGHYVRVFDLLNVDTSNLVDALPYIESTMGDFPNESDIPYVLHDNDLVVHLISTTFPKI